jgi:hypothetical protein
MRWIVLAMLTSCMAAQEVGTPSQTQEAAPATQQSAATGSTAPASSGFPFDKFQEFSAIMVGSVLRGDDREGHIYRSGDVLRMQGTEGLGYFLTDLKSFETYGITRLGCLSDSHLYFRAFPFSVVKPGRKLERVTEGKETVDGHVSQVETVTVSGGDLRMPIKLKFWEADDLQGFPVQVQILNGGGKGTIQYKNVVLGPVDPTLFLRPKHCAGGLPQPPAKKPGAKTKPATPAAGK